MPFCCPTIEDILDPTIYSEQMSGGLLFGGGVVQFPKSRTISVAPRSTTLRNFPLHLRIVGVGENFYFASEGQELAALRYGENDFLVRVDLGTSTTTIEVLYE